MGLVDVAGATDDGRYAGLVAHEARIGRELHPDDRARRAHHLGVRLLERLDERVVSVELGGLAEQLDVEVVAQIGVADGVDAGAQAGDGLVLRRAGQHPPVDLEAAALGDHVVRGASLDDARVAGRPAQELVLGVAEVGVVQREHDLGHLLDGRHPELRPAAVDGYAVGRDRRSQQAALGDAHAQ